MSAKALDGEILKASEYTVKVAKQQFGRDLDYSVETLPDLDLLIEATKRHLARLSAEGKPTEPTIHRASVSIGSYLGEVVRRKYGGAWIANAEATSALIVDGREISPILFVLNRLTDKNDLRTEDYWSEMKLGPSAESESRSPAPLFSEASGPLPASKPFGQNTTLIAVGGIAAVAILVVGAVTIWSGIRASNQFGQRFDAFLIEAEKLDVMTEEGVAYQEFQDQFYEVKAAYNLIGPWPASHRAEKSSFDLAIKGWSYALGVWQLKLGISIEVLEDWQGLINYVGGGLWSALEQRDEIIRASMAKASLYFAAGKAGMR